MSGMMKRSWSQILGTKWRDKARKEYVLQHVHEARVVLVSKKPWKQKHVGAMLRHDGNAMFRDVTEGRLLGKDQGKEDTG